MGGLFIFVEGNDDERFISHIIEPILEGRYEWIKIVKYANYERRKISNLIRSIQSINSDYIFLADKNNHPCISAKKNSIKRRWDFLDEDKIFIVVNEIEGWYLAGVTNINPQIPIPESTEGITKEDFNQLIPSRFVSRVDFMHEILKQFSIQRARERNSSFDYFLRKFIGI